MKAIIKNTCKAFNVKKGEEVEITEFIKDPILGDCAKLKDKSFFMELIELEIIEDENK